MTVRTATQLKSDADTLLPDNSGRLISPEDVRERITDLADSIPLIAGGVTPEEFGSTGYDTAQAAVGASDDSGPQINTLLETYGLVFLPRFYSIKTSIVLPTGGVLIGRSRYSSGLVINADVDGVRATIYNEVANFRIRGTATMTSASACLSVGEEVSQTYRSRFANLILGGAQTGLGDSANQNISGDCIRGGLFFLNECEHIYAQNGRYGLDLCKANGNTNAAVSASAFIACEFQSNEVGARLGRLKGVSFSGCSFASNDEHGLIIGFCQGTTVLASYFESNHKSSAVTTKADLIVDPALVGETDPGGGLTIRDNWFTKGVGSTFAIWIEKHRNVRIAENGINSGYGTDAIGIAVNVLNTGLIQNNRAPDGITNGNPDGMIES